MRRNTLSLFIFTIVFFLLLISPLFSNITQQKACAASLIDCGDPHYQSGYGSYGFWWCTGTIACPSLYNDNGKYVENNSSTSTNYCKSQSYLTSICCVDPHVSDPSPTPQQQCPSSPNGMCIAPQASCSTYNMSPDTSGTYTCGNSGQCCLSSKISPPPPSSNTCPAAPHGACVPTTGGCPSGLGNYTKGDATCHAEKGSLYKCCSDLPGAIYPTIAAPTPTGKLAPTATAAPPTPPCIKNSSGNCVSVDTGFGSVPIDVTAAISQLFGILLSFAGGIVILIIVFSGYRLMTSQGDPEKIKGAREMLTAAIIGLLFVIFSVTILRVIGIDILHIPGLNFK